MSEIGFISTGDAAEDEKLARDFILHDERINAGCCPNGCGGMVEVDRWNAECPKCHFGLYQAGGLNFPKVNRQ